MTLGVHLLLPAGIAAMGAALGLPTPAVLYFLFVPVIYILAAVPVSIGGLGVVESMYIVFFAQGGRADSSLVLAVALLARLTPMLLSLPGLVFWLVERAARGPVVTRDAAVAAQGGSATPRGPAEKRP